MSIKAINMWYWKDSEGEFASFGHGTSLYWNIWSNYYSKGMLKELEEYLREYESPDHQILTILVNTDRDLQEDETDPAASY